MIPLRFIGDVHGHIDRYVELCREAEHTVQVGDLGFRTHYAEVVAQVDATRHRFVPGNHDDYDALPPHSLGDFGVHCAGQVEMFFVRGAFSIDAKYRTPHLNWWPDEQLSSYQLEDAIDLYRQVKPRLVVSHDCPLDVTPQVGDAKVLRAFGYSAELRTRTQLALQTMLDAHAPERWIFGHYHRNRHFTEQGVAFTCLAELGTLDWPES